MVAEAEALCEEDVRRTGRWGSGGRSCSSSCAARRARVHTHCNAGGLACVEWGTALGIVRAIHERAGRRR